MMKRFATLTLCAALACAAAAGPLLTGEVTVAAGQTNSAAEITLNFSGSADAPAIDRLVIANASGTGTGTVAFAAVAAGVAVQIAATNAIAPGVQAAVWPRREVASGALTNAEAYTAHRLRVTVDQTATAADTVYTFGAIVR